MKAFIEGNLRIVENAAFKDSKTGETVPFWYNHIQDGEGKLIKIGSRDNHTDLVGRDCVIAVEVKPDFENQKLFRLSVADVKADK